MSKRLLTRTALTAFIVTAMLVPVGLTGSSSVAAPAAPVRCQTNVLVRGSPIHGANGLAIDSQGRLVVASAYGGELVALNPDGDVLGGWCFSRA